MAQMVLGTAGALVGGLIGGPTGAQIGWSLGSMLGASMGPKAQGPRLNDTRVTTSTYGAPRVRAYGTVRVGGNIFWSTKLIEHEIDSGKGGPPPTANYEYSASFAIGLCEGPIVGIRRIWVGGKLRYDVSGLGVDLDGNAVVTRPDGTVVHDIDKVTKVESAIASLSLGRYMQVFTGSEDQLPWSTMQAHEGDLTSAYRGEAYVGFTDLPLKDLNNSIAQQWEFEVVVHGASASNAFKAFSIGDHNDVRSHVTVMMDTTKCQFAGQHSNGDISLYNAAPGASTASESQRIQSDGFIANTLSTLNDDKFGFGVACDGAFENITVLDPNSSSPDHTTIFYRSTSVRIFDRYGIKKHELKFPFNDARPCTIAHAQDDTQHGVYAIAGNVYSPNTVIVFKDGQTPYIPRGLQATTGLTKLTIDKNLLFVTYNSGQSLYVYDLSLAWDALPIASIGCAETVYMSAIQARNGVVYGSGTAIDGVTGKIVRCRYDAGERVLTTLATFTPPAGSTQKNNGTFASLICDDTAAILDCETSGSVGNPVSNGALVITMNAPAPTDYRVADIVDQVCLRAGMSRADFDTSALTETILGYTISGRMSGRAAIQPLMMYSYFDACEVDYRLTFVNRGASASFDIPAADLGASIGGAPNPDLVKIDRNENLETPNGVSVVYSSLPASYAQASQYARRLTQPGANKVQSVQMPVVMTDTKAAQIASVMLYDAWTARTSMSFDTSMQWSKLMPTDTGYVTQQDGRRYFVRITKKDESLGVIKFQAVLEDSSVYTQTPAASPMSSVNQAIALDGPTDLFLLDLPLLQDANPAPGIYVAGAGYTLGWPGFALYRSTDGIAYAKTGIGSSSTSFFGAATTALPIFLGGNVIDEISRVTVKMNAGQLYSITDDLLLKNGNAALLGTEIICFRTATLVAENTYVLSGFLRGRKGTEAGSLSHQAGDRFIMLDNAKILDLAVPATDLGVAHSYKGVTFGAYVETTDKADFVYRGANVKPLSPVHIEAGKTSSAGDLQIQWVRRSRIDQTWRDNGDVLLGESTELYDVEIRDAAGGYVIRTISNIPVSNVVYPASQQIADFGALPSIFTVVVYQRSSIAGRGFPGSTQITV